LKHGKEMMGSLYTFPRRLLWRRWEPKLSKLSQHFFFDLVRKLSDTPRMYVYLCVYCRNAVLFGPSTQKGCSSDRFLEHVGHSCADPAELVIWLQLVVL
jgi:hypothetical protein